MAVMNLHIKYGTAIFIQSGVIDIFPKFKMAAAMRYSASKYSVTLKTGLAVVQAFKVIETGAVQ